MGGSKSGTPKAKWRNSPEGLYLLCIAVALYRNNSRDEYLLARFNQIAPYAAKYLGVQPTMAALMSRGSHSKMKDYASEWPENIPQGPDFYRLAERLMAMDYTLDEKKFQSDVASVTGYGAFKFEDEPEIITRTEVQDAIRQIHLSLAILERYTAQNGD